MLQLTNPEIRINPARILYIMDDTITLEGGYEVSIEPEDIARFSNLVKLVEDFEEEGESASYWINPDHISFIECNSVLMSNGTELKVKSIDPLIK